LLRRLLLGDERTAAVYRHLPAQGDAFLDHPRVLVAPRAVRVRLRRSADPAWARCPLPTWCVTSCPPARAS